MLFRKPTLKEARQFGFILEEFQQALGSLINGENQIYYFSTHTQEYKAI